MKNDFEKRQAVTEVKTINAFQKKALKGFFKGLGLDHFDIISPMTGQLDEDCFKDISYFYGNGELIASNDKFLTVWVVDKIGFDYSLSIITEEITNGKNL